MRGDTIMKRTTLRLGLVALALSLAACATVPGGPSVLVLPGTGKSFDQFRVDDAACRQYALQQIGGAAQAAQDSAVRSAVVGTAVGAAAGAAIGGSRGAGVGAGTGLIFGSAAGSEASYSSTYGAQRAYDHAYVQCMYAAGHRVPVSGAFTGTRGYASSPSSGAAGAAPARSVTPPPPPPGAPPPPPTR